MATTNKGYATPSTGSEIDNWGNVLNANAVIVDNNFGGITTVNLSGGGVTLNATQAQSALIRLTGALPSSVTLTFPSVGGFFIIDNQTTSNTGAFVVVITCGGGNNICAIPGEVFDIFTDGTNTLYRNLGRVGSYIDYATAAAPTWVTACTVPPYLICEGATFSAATYPALAGFLGTTTLPDFRGRNRSYLNGGTGRITTAGSGIDGNTRFSGGGSQVASLSTDQLPVTTPTVASFALNYDKATVLGTGGGDVGSTATFVQSLLQTSTAVSGSISMNSFGSGLDHLNMPPTAIGGITLVRAG